MLVQAFTFGAKNHRAIHLVIDLVVALSAALIQADDPNIAVLQLFERARDVGHACDGQMFGSSSRSLDRGACQSRGAPLGDDDSVSACAIGGANQRAQVVRIFDPVEHNDEAVLAAMLLQQRVDVGILFSGGDRDDALMGVGVGQAIKLFAWKKAHLHAAGAAIVNQALHPFVMPLARDADVLEAARA